jgi:mRNA-degrading endonuclease YafQ of YafQ-DinJ toxin-antitoxin module
MFYVASYKQKRVRQATGKTKGQITVMNNDKTEDDAELSNGLSHRPQNSLQKFGKTEDDADENFLITIPREINRRINKGQFKKTLKEDVEIGELQVKHIKNANEFYDEAFNLQTKEKDHQLKTLDLDHKILVKNDDIADHEQRQKLKALRHENEQLTLEIEIAEKQARLAQLKNPQKAEKSEPSFKEKIERAELELSKLRREHTGSLIEILNNREYDQLSDDEKQRHDETSIDFDSRIHALREKIEKLRAKTG